MPAFEWENVDVPKALKDFENLRKVRGEIIDSAINLEDMLEVIICKILFNSYISKEAVMFRRFLVSQSVGFYAKVCFLENVVRYNKPPKAHLTKQWLEKLKGINTVRNFLAHGNASGELPLKNQESTEMTISLIKNGEYKSIKMTKNEVEKIKKDIHFCLKFVYDNLVKKEEKEIKKYFG